MLEYGFGFDISFLYDDINFGDDLMFIVYNDRCFNCNFIIVICIMLVILWIKLKFISWYYRLERNEIV